MLERLVIVKIVFGEGLTIATMIALRRKVVSTFQSAANVNRNIPASTWGVDTRRGSSIGESYIIPTYRHPLVASSQVISPGRSAAAS
jgi:hypothetical protein